MILRAALVGAIVGLAFLIVWVLERRRVAPSVGLPAGLTLVTGAGCSLCPRAIEEALRLSVPVRIVDVRELADNTVMSLPTLFVTSGDGVLLARRTGRSVVSEMPRLAELATRSAPI